jgi:hypothetical protein
VGRGEPVSGRANHVGLDLKLLEELRVALDSPAAERDIIKRIKHPVGAGDVIPLRPLMSATVARR